MKNILFLLMVGSYVLTPVEPTVCLLFNPCEQICKGIITAECSCYAGYTISRYDKDKCDDIDECTQLNPCGKGRCENTRGSYTCSCRNGYITSTNGYCVDIDECRRSSPCQHKCTNTDGSFRCSCNSGFAPSKTNPTRCVAVNNCQQGTRPSTLDPSKCVDIDECAETRPCQQLCVNSQGSYECGCESGFNLSDQDFTTCLPKDPCASNPCQHSCSKTNTGYKCSCRRGYAISKADPTKCEDIDECNVYKPCNQVCLNNPGSYECSCNEGYTKSLEDPNFCVAIDFCKDDPCEQICKNTATGFQCSCREGYQISKSNTTKCEDIDECAVTNSCHQICTNTQGSYKCSCKEGYSTRLEDSAFCVDIDECTVEKPCNQVCLNNPGSYECSCNEGYILNPEDPNLCVELPREKCSTNTCEHNCTDTSTGYKCSCLPGYNVSKSDPKKCEDIDECTTSEPCQQICKNIVGSYVCSCRDNYVVVPENPSRCEEIEVCKIKADVILVYDSSTSIGEEHYAKQFEFSKKLIKNFAVGLDAVRFAAIIFSRTAKLLFTLKENDDYNSIDEGLTNVPYLKSVTLTELAFQLIDKEALFSPEKGGRDDAPDFVVLFTDGDPNNLPATLNAAKKLKDNGVHIFSVGIGKEVKEDVLGQTASSPSDTFLATDFDRLPQIEKELTSIICNAARSA